MEAILSLEASDGLEKELHPSEECGANFLNVELNKNIQLYILI